MTEEQMEILRKQIAMYAVICGQLVSLHESLSSKLPVSSGTTEMLVSFKIVKTASGFVIRLRPPHTDDEFIDVAGNRVVAGNGVVALLICSF
ncbi:unnamed protein product [Brassica rapa subsp. narinosa]